MSVHNCSGRDALEIPAEDVKDQVAAGDQSNLRGKPLRVPGSQNHGPRIELTRGMLGFTRSSSVVLIEQFCTETREPCLYT